MSMLDVAAGLENPLVPLAEAGEILQADIRQRFETETDPSENPWEPLSWRYIMWKPGQGQRPINPRRRTGTTLKDTKDLMEAATSDDTILIRGDTLFYQLGLLPEYGIAHDTGLEERQNPLPQRQFIGLSEEAKDVIEVSFDQWFIGNINLYPTSTGKLGQRWGFRAKPGGFFLPRSSAGV